MLPISVKFGTSGLARLPLIANRAPPVAHIAAETPNTSVLVRALFTPITAAAVSLSRIGDQRPSDSTLHDAAAHEVRDHEHEHREPPHEHRAPLATPQLAEDRPRRDVVVRDPVDAAGAVGEPRRLLPLHELREQHGEAQRDERQVDPLQPERGKGRRASDDEAEDRRDIQRPALAPVVVVDQHGRRVAAEPEVRGVPDRDDPAEPHRQVERHRRDGELQGVRHVDDRAGLRLGRDVQQEEDGPQHPQRRGCPSALGCCGGA